MRVGANITSTQTINSVTVSGAVTAPPCDPTPVDADGLAPDRHMRRQTVSSRAAIRRVRPTGQAAGLNAEAAAEK